MAVSVDDVAVELDQLYRETMADLDLEGGGIRWMQHQLDWQRGCLIGEYFLSAVTGVRGSIYAAALSADRFREKQHADNHWLASRWAEVRKDPGATRDDYLRAMVRGKAESRRELELLTSADHCFFHLARASKRSTAASEPSSKSPP